MLRQSTLRHLRSKVRDAMFSIECFSDFLRSQSTVLTYGERWNAKPHSSIPFSTHERNRATLTRNARASRYGTSIG